MAETILNRIDPARFCAFSAGSQPSGEVNPLALDLLARLDLATDGLRSKSWNEFAQPAAPRLDFVFTVCDRAAKEVCPVWPGQPMSAHWGIADPAVAGGDMIERTQRFRTAFAELERRIKLFAALPFAALDDLRLQQAIDDIGQH